MKISHTRKNTASAKWLLLCMALVALLQGTYAQEEETLPDDQTSDEEGYATELERQFDYINAFLAGFRSNEILPSATNCTFYLEDSINVYNNTRESWKDEEVSQNMTTRDYVYNTTSWISFNLAPSSRYCVMSGLEGYSWTLLKRS